MMKKIIIPLAGMLAVTAFVPEASAIPAFSRQVGVACDACHAQHFPVLNNFGRAFKSSGYTMMGAQGKVEGERLSIPSTLNASLLLKYRHVKRSDVPGSTGTGAGTNAGDGQWQMGDELSLFAAGRVAENIGFMLEANTLGTGANTGNSLLSGIKIPFVFDVTGAKLGIIPFTTDMLGVAYGFELSSDGAMRANRWAEQRRDSSAMQYALADGSGDNNYTGAASGFAFLAQNDLGFINYTRWTPNFMPGGNGQSIASYDMRSNYLRIAATPTVGDWAMLIGGGSMSGSSEVGITGNGLVPALVANGAVTATKASFVDLQAQGQLAGKDFSVYANWAQAPASGAGCVPGTATNNQCNLYNPSRAVATSAFVLAADYSLAPHIFHLGMAYRSGTRATTAANRAGAGVSSKDNSLLISAVYDITQNVALHLNQSFRGGSFYDAALGATAISGKRETLLMLEAGW